jgi:hypothetical protein
MKSISFKNDILEVADGESILAIRMDTSPFYRSDCARKELSKHLDKQVISWEEAAPFLDYPYDTGYGAQDCHDIVAWTENKVIYIHEYDGSTSVCYLDRNPK